MDDLEIVADRLGNAARPSRELDSLLADGFMLLVPKDLAGWPPRFTGSIDAAMRLLPGGFHWEIKTAPHRKGYFCEAWAIHGNVVAAIGDAATAAMAVCIVAAKLHPETGLPLAPPDTQDDMPSELQEEAELLESPNEN